MKYRRLALLTALAPLLSFPALSLAGRAAEEKAAAKEKSADPGKAGKAAKPAGAEKKAGKKDEAADDQEAAPKTRTVAEIEKDMKKAVTAKNYTGLWTL